MKVNKASNSKWAYILAPVLAATIMNGVIYGLGWNRNNDSSKSKEKENPWMPPGYVIAVVWTLIFGLLGWTLWLIRGAWMAYSVIAITIVYCLMYPLLTMGLKKEYFKPYNIGAFVLAIICTCLVALEAGVGNLVGVVPLLLWTSYVVAFIT